MKVTTSQINYSKHYTEIKLTGRRGLKGKARFDYESLVVNNHHYLLMMIIYKSLWYPTAGQTPPFLLSTLVCLKQLSPILEVGVQFNNHHI